MAIDKSPPSETPQLEEISDGDLDSVQGGAGYVKFDGIDGECKVTTTIKVTPSDMNWKVTPVDIKNG